MNIHTFVNSQGDRVMPRLAPLHGRETPFLDEISDGFVIFLQGPRKSGGGAEGVLRYTSEKSLQLKCYKTDKTGIQQKLVSISTKLRLSKNSFKTFFELELAPTRCFCFQSHGSVVIYIDKNIMG